MIQNENEERDNAENDAILNVNVQSQIYRKPSPNLNLIITLCIYIFLL